MNWTPEARLEALRLLGVAEERATSLPHALKMARDMVVEGVGLLDDDATLDIVAGAIREAEKSAAATFRRIRAARRAVTG